VPVLAVVVFVFRLEGAMFTLNVNVFYESRESCLDFDCIFVDQWKNEPEKCGASNYP
jgi:hypothetical protein